MLKIRRPLGRLIFNMGIAIPGKTVFLIETAPWTAPSHYLNQCWNIVNWTLGNKLQWKSKFVYFYSIKCIWKRRLRNDGHFVQGPERWVKHPYTRICTIWLPTCMIYKLMSLKLCFVNGLSFYVVIKEFTLIKVIIIISGESKPGVQKSPLIVSIHAISRQAYFIMLNLLYILYTRADSRLAPS